MKARVTVYAKINLLLDVLHKRSDGYHEVAMVMQAVDLADTLLVETSSRNWLVTDNKYIPPNMNNLAMKAVTLMQSSFPQVTPLKVTLRKKIPVAAGLAGGSTDCAGMLLAIDRMFHLGLPQKELQQLAAQLGSDVPFCLGGPTSLASGRGELLEALPPCPTFYFVLVKPDFGVSTPRVYGNLKVEEITDHPDLKRYLQALAQKDQDYLLAGMANVLEQSTFILHPAVKKLKAEMQSLGCQHVLMSGSGPTVFAVFKERSAAQRYYEKARQRYKRVFLSKTVEPELLQERVQIL